MAAEPLTGGGGGGLQQPWYRTILHSLSYETLVAGLIGGSLSTLVLHPLDVVKIQLQVSENHSLAERHVFSNMRDVIRGIARGRGLAGFYQGVAPNLVGAASSWGLYFFIFNTFKAATLEQEGVTALSFAQQVSYAAMAGAMTLSLTNPIWVVKTRMVLQSGSAPTTLDSTHTDYRVRYRGLFHGLSSLARTEGLAGLYRGYLPGLLGVSHGVVQFVSYERMKAAYYTSSGTSTTEKLGVAPYIALSAASKVLAVAATYPYQVVRSRLQDSSCRYTGVMDVVGRTWMNEGAAGFYRGILPNLLRVTPACCITFLCYENVVHAFRTYRT